jgi:hypothetical protein
VQIFVAKVGLMLHTVRGNSNRDLRTGQRVAEAEILAIGHLRLRHAALLQQKRTERLANQAGPSRGRAFRSATSTPAVPQPAARESAPDPIVYGWQQERRLWSRRRLAIPEAGRHEIGNWRLHMFASASRG